MEKEWAAEIAGRMFVAGVTGRQLASECGYTNTYLSEVLHNKKGNDATRVRISEALTRLERQGRSNGKRKD